MRRPRSRSACWRRRASCPAAAAGAGLAIARAALGGARLHPRARRAGRGAGASAPRPVPAPRAWPPRCAPATSRPRRAAGSRSCACPSDRAQLAGAAARALAAAGPLPTVLAVAARDDELDVLLAARDAILVALPSAAEPALAQPRPRRGRRARPARRDARARAGSRPAGAGAGRRARAARDPRRRGRAGPVSRRAARGPSGRIRPGGDGPARPARGGRPRRGRPGRVARGVGVRGELQSAADLSALAAARAMHDAYPRVFEPPVARRRRQPAPPRARRLPRAGRARGAGDRGAQRRTRRARRLPRRSARPDPRAGDRARRDRGRRRDAVPNTATAEAELAPPGALPGAGALNGGRVPRPVRLPPGQADAPRRRAGLRPHGGRRPRRRGGAARSRRPSAPTPSRRGSSRRTPIPKWVAPPGTSLHRLGTELDLGPPSAYGWLAANAERFHFVQRYAWEPWHFGFTLNAGSSSLGYGTGGDGDGRRARCRPSCRRASRRRSRARRSAGACRARCWPRSSTRSRTSTRSRARAPGRSGIAQFMPATAAGYGLADPFDAERAIDAQAHLMRDLLRAFALGPARARRLQRGPARVRACGCIPPIPETRVLRRRHPRPAARRGRPVRRRRGGRWRCGSCAE